MTTCEFRRQERYGCSCDTLSLGDVQRNSQLRSDLASMPLSAYFDDRGVPHFRRLGLSFAARQNPTVRPAFGTWVDRQAEAATIHKRQSAKSYFLATEALEKDEVYGKAPGGGWPSAALSPLQRARARFAAPR